MHSGMGWPLGNVRPEFASKPGLIIGGSSGIGKAAGTLQLEQRADAVVIVGKNKKKLLAAEVELSSFGQVTTNNTYVADTAPLDLLLAEIDSNFAAVDLLVNSAGVFLPKSFQENPSPQIRMQKATASLQTEALRPSGIL
jgi:NAD(P)-dependent dehydrogenase (short-subunit alcohol dehydrogenase family)